ncbi:hypothetical protein FRC19_002286 [Serendipita sp. 401]|nr:hypothetical protein FRC19_002286 [Serendipita sp. 401]
MHQRVLSPSARSITVQVSLFNGLEVSASSRTDASLTLSMGVARRLDGSSTSLGNTATAEPSATPGHAHGRGPSSMAIGGAIGGLLCGLIILFFVARMIYLHRRHSSYRMY